MGRLEVSRLSDFIIRTEDIRPSEMLAMFVPTERDKQLVSLLESPTPLIIEGSRGTGKTFLMRVCEQTQISRIRDDRIVPVFLSFSKSSLIESGDDKNIFFNWMMARLCSQILRTLQKNGLYSAAARTIETLTGETGASGDTAQPTRLEQIAEAYEASYKVGSAGISNAEIPTIEQFRESIEDICEELSIERFNILFDEAAHIFRPEQQRQFFTLFRDLRSPYITCNAAVYPGVTSYGGVFESTHDARIEALNRDITNSNYIMQMRDIVAKQADAAQLVTIAKRGENFDALAYAVSGNPRLLLKTFALAGRLSTSEVQSVLKEFYRTAIWSEHTSLSDRYPGHKGLIDWGRNFVEEVVIPDLTRKNESWKAEGRPDRSATIWISRDAPAAAKEAVRLLTYTGILTKLDDGVVGTRRQYGARYLVNIGCLVAPASSPIQLISEIRSGNSIKRFSEFGANYSGFSHVTSIVGKFVEADTSKEIKRILSKSINVLDLSEHQRNALIEMGITTIGEAMNANEQIFQKAKYIGPKRSRKMMNVVAAAALEYLSG